MFCGHCYDEPCSCQPEVIISTLNAIPDKRLNAFNLINQERDRQNKMWGRDDFKHIFEFICALGEEYGEVCEAVNESYFPEKRPENGGKSNIINEVTQVGALCVKLIESLIISDADEFLKRGK